MEEVEEVILSEETPGQGAEGRGEEGEGKGEGVVVPVECLVLVFGQVHPSQPRDRGPDTQHAQEQQQRGARAWGRPLRGHPGNTVLPLVLVGGEVVTAGQSQAEGEIIEAVFGLQLLRNEYSLLFLCYHPSSFIDVHIVIDFVFYIVPPPSPPPVDRSTRSSRGSRVLQSASIYN